MTLLQDLRFALRLLVKDRWFTLAAGSALALGIGANATVFTLVNAVLVRGLPFPEPDRIIALQTSNGRGRTNGVSPSEFADWREQSKTMSDLSATLGSVVNVADEAGKAPEQVQGAYVSTNIFRLIGETPVLGRGFTDADDRPGADAVAVIGHGLWQTRYGGDPAVLGTIIRANSKPYTVVGVMKPDMMFPSNNVIWLPAIQLPPDSLNPNRDNRSFGTIVGRLAPGATLAQARGEFAAIGQRLADAYPASSKELRPDLMRFNDRFRQGPVALLFLSMQGAVAFVLLIACANVANLLLSRAAGRAREIAVRTALGARRWRIVRQLLIESLLLAVLSGAAGFALVPFGIRWFDIATQDVGKPYFMTFDLDAAVFAFIAAICLGTAVLFGLAPALHVSRTDPNVMLKEGGRGGTGRRARRWTGALIVTELVLTIVLLSGAGYMMRSFFTMYTMDLGFGTSRLLTLQIYLPLTKYPQPGPRRVVFERFEERVRGIPSIESATLTTNPPLGGAMGRVLSLNGQPPATGEAPLTVSMLTVSDAYFDTLGVRLIRGRALNAEDGTPGHGTAVVNQRFAALHFPNQDPVGRQITLLTSVNQKPLPAPITIVGVAPNIRQRGCGRAAAGSGGLPALSGGCRPSDDADRPDRRRARGRRGEPPGSHARRRARPAALQHPHAG